MLSHSCVILNESFSRSKYALFLKGLQSIDSHDVTDFILKYEEKLCRKRVQILLDYLVISVVSWCVMT